MISTSFKEYFLLCKLTFLTFPPFQLVMSQNLSQILLLDMGSYGLLRCYRMLLERYGVLFSCILWGPYLMYYEIDFGTEWARLQMDGHEGSPYRKSY